MPYYLLMYESTSDYPTKRAPYRPEHLALARAAAARGELLLGGAYADPADGAVLVFRAENPDVVQRFADADPYVRHGVVRAWSIRPWTVVVGSLMPSGE